MGHSESVIVKRASGGLKLAKLNAAGCAGESHRLTVMRLAPEVEQVRLSTHWKWTLHTYMVTVAVSVAFGATGGPGRPPAVSNGCRATVYDFDSWSP